jgi:putative transposase
MKRSSNDFQNHYGEEQVFPDGQMPFYRMKLASISEFVRDIKVNFARYYNRSHNRRGYFWGDRFKSVIVDKGETLVNCLAYIDLNPLRAGIVKNPRNTAGPPSATTCRPATRTSSFPPISG